jgi:hypothetical protein
MPASTTRADDLRRLLPRSRVWTSRQLAALVYGDTTATATRECERVLNRLLASKCARRTRVFARPTPDLSGGPLLRWEPGGGLLPDVGKITWRAFARWVEPPRMQTVWHAGRRLLSHVAQAGDGRLRQPGQVTHDLCVTQILTELVSTQARGEDAAGWIGEEHLGKLIRGKVPDAVIARPGGLPLAIDFTGSYPADRVERVMRFYSRLGLPFELW